MLAGTVDHGDSLGNQGAPGAGDVQWMTAGSGILHQEMPKGDAVGRMRGFQLWANLPSSLKMTEPRYLDISVPANTSRTLKVETERHAFAYVFEGAASFRDASPPFGVLTKRGTPDAEVDIRETGGKRSLILFDAGDEIQVTTGDDGVRFLLVSGRPIKEPVAWYGPIVMNTRSGLKTAISELNDGSFIKHI